MEHCMKKSIMSTSYTTVDWVSHYLILSSPLLLPLKFTLEQAMKAQRGSRGIGLLFL
jgi:hypothetical protein